MYPINNIAVLFQSESMSKHPRCILDVHSYGTIHHYLSCSRWITKCVMHGYSQQVEHLVCLLFHLLEVGSPSQVMWNPHPKLFHYSYYLYFLLVHLHLHQNVACNLMFFGEEHHHVLHVLRLSVASLIFFRLVWSWLHSVKLLEHFLLIWVAGCHLRSTDELSILSWAIRV